MCEILDEIENRGIQKGMDIMRAEKDAALAKKDAIIDEKNEELAKKDAKLAQAMELLKKHNIAFAP